MHQALFLNSTLKSKNLNITKIIDISVDEKIKALVLRKLLSQQVAPQEETATSGGE